MVLENIDPIEGDIRILSTPHDKARTRRTRQLVAAVFGFERENGG